MKSEPEAPFSYNPNTSEEIAVLPTTWGGGVPYMVSGVPYMVHPDAEGFALPEAKRARQDLASASVGDSPMGLPPPVTDASAKARQSGRSLTPADLPNPSAAPHPVQCEIGRHRLERSAVNQEAQVAGLELHDQVMHNFDWEERQMLLEKAKTRRAEGALTDEDVYLLNMFLVGNCECFKEQGR